MITYESLCRHPSAFRSLTGFSVEAFQTLFGAFARAHDERCRACQITRRGGKPRQRAYGAGRRYAHDQRTRLLMALVWLRLYPTYALLGFFFSLDKANARDNVLDVLATLETRATFAFERPAAERKKLRTLAGVMEAFPDVCLVIDAKEQRIQRPKSTPTENRQKPYYSGKKKCHTLKTQVGVLPDGQMGAVAPSVPGATNDLTLLRNSGLIERLDPAEEAAMLDAGYTGIRHDYPAHTLHVAFRAARNHPLTAEQKAANRQLAKYRVVVEHTLAQMNQFQALAQVYRHEREGHSRTVRVVAWLVTQRIRERPLKRYTVA